MVMRGDIWGTGEKTWKAARRFVMCLIYYIHHPETESQTAEGAPG
jgi:hypothetical protein